MGISDGCGPAAMRAPCPTLCDLLRAIHLRAARCERISIRRFRRRRSAESFARHMKTCARSVLRPGRLRDQLARLPMREAKHRVALVVPGGVDRTGEYRVIPALLSLLERLATRFDVDVFALTQET